MEKWERELIRPFHLNYWGTPLFDLRLDVKNGCCDTDTNLQVWRNNESWAQWFYKDNQDRIVSVNCHQ